MTIEQMFNIESDEKYFGRTTEEQRIEEAREYITGILVSGNYETGWSIDRHIDELQSNGMFSEDNARLLKKYMAGFADGYQRANSDRDKSDKYQQWAMEAEEIVP